MEESEKLLKILTELKSDLLDKANEVNLLDMSQRNRQIMASLNSELSLHINTLKNEKDTKA